MKRILTISFFIMHTILVGKGIVMGFDVYTATIATVWMIGNLVGPLLSEYLEQRKQAFGQMETMVVEMRVLKADCEDLMKLKDEMEKILNSVKLKEAFKR